MKGHGKQIDARVEEEGVSSACSSYGKVIFIEHTQLGL